MRFESKEQKEELIKSFEEKRVQLEEVREKEKKDVNYNHKVILDYRCEYDSDGLEYEESDQTTIKSCKGDIYFFFFNQPKLIDTIKIFDSSSKNGIYQTSLLAWQAMFDDKNSSLEASHDRIKLGYLPKMVNCIDALMGDQKKKLDYLTENIINKDTEMTVIYAAHLRHHYRISPDEWEKRKYSEEFILRWYFEFLFIKEDLGEIQMKPNQQTN